MLPLVVTPTHSLSCCWLLRRETRPFCKDSGGGQWSVPLHRAHQRCAGSQVEPALWPVSVCCEGESPLSLCSSSFTCPLHLCLLHTYSLLSHSDSIIISIWNSKKVHKRQGAGFLGCVKLSPAGISKLKDTGCKQTHMHMLKHWCHDCMQISQFRD